MAKHLSAGAILTSLRRSSWIGDKASRKSRSPDRGGVTARLAAAPTPGRSRDLRDGNTQKGCAEERRNSAAQPLVSCLKRAPSRRPNLSQHPASPVAFLDVRKLLQRAAKLALAGETTVQQMPEYRFWCSSVRLKPVVATIAEIAFPAFDVGAALRPDAACLAPRR